MKEVLDNQYVQLLLAIATLSSLVLIFYNIFVKLIKKEKTKRMKRRQVGFYRELDGEKFMKWRDLQLKKIYGDCHFTDIKGTLYPVFLMPFSEYFKYQDFKKKEVYSKDDVQNDGYSVCNGEVVFPPFYETSIMREGTKDEIRKKKKLIKQYRRILTGSIKYPKLAGFSLDHYGFNDKGEVTHIYPKLGTYEYNVFSSHILEYELFTAYKKVKGKNVKLEELWPLLPFRHYIHYGTGDVDKTNDALYSGARRYSLFSVQCIVVFKDHNHKEYMTLLMKRSTDPEKVAAKLGYYQFLPAGGFELYEKEQIHSVEMIKENYSLRKAIFREYLEEVFDEKEFKTVIDSTNSETTDKIINHPKVAQVVSMIEDGRATLNLLGIAVDLVSLRHEISFVLKIEDEAYSREGFCPNDEFTRANSVASKVRISLKRVEELLDGSQYQKKEAPKFNQASALLYKMFKESPFYPEK